MKPLNEKNVFLEQQQAQDRLIGIMTMIQQQIDIVAGLMERNKDLTKSPMHYNVCCGLIDQLKSHSNASFHEGGGIAPFKPDGMPTPYFTFPTPASEESNFESIREYAAGKSGNLFGKS